MPLFPLFADLSGREVLVVGGGEVAQRKIEALLQAGAQVQVYADALNQTVAQWWAQGRLQRREGGFDPAWLDQVWLLVAATDDRPFNAGLAAEAGRRRRLVNVVDDAELSTFQIPAIVDRDPLLVAISSGGAAPMLARRLREQLETLLDHSLGDLAALFARHRAAIRARLPQLAQRRRWFDQVIDGPVPVLLRAGQREAAEAAFQTALQASADTTSAGSVTLVGAGNGDPGLLTLNALRALNQADLLVVDDAVAPAVLALARRDASRLRMPEDDDARLALLVQHATAGQRVVCLKPGNAFQLPPDMQLADELERRRIACEVIAGIDAAA
ncbi:NAD(P)-dependent oxidoreductase [Pseudoxanthomonas wuyuanensis]|uniref:precorrin-2 dehydrogenase n=1 Tax=Pseudoxanthomonas wuyuanensis TaxID=1073196 RepID=A0A286CZ61_9GAMM|nr:NAD(P)-dependent oxidoreductase [Pseudoxanthomonas wuyuanensis]KAF1722272.1 siroheme synthase [Pseudoxanthomonas wuyuanensis]SOD51659.1 precorrin-2 dehydrogenase [Pseudoxanthomonas wuyuanensis]